MKKYFYSLILVIIFTSTVLAQTQYGFSSGLLLPIGFMSNDATKFEHATFLSLAVNKSIKKSFDVGIGLDWFLLNHSKLTPIEVDKESYNSHRNHYLSLSTFVDYTSNIGSGKLKTGLGISGNFNIWHRVNEIIRNVGDEDILSRRRYKPDQTLFSPSFNARIQYDFSNGIFVGYEFRYLLKPFFQTIYNANVGLNFIKIGYKFSNSR